MRTVRVEGLTKSWGKTAALRGIDLELEPGRITVLLGPSGCGKTTLLRILAGLVRPDAGRVLFDGEPVNDPAPLVPTEARGLGMVFQDALLWPHLTVRKNIGFPLGSRKDREAAVREAAAAAHVERFLDRYPAELSGGERQRVAIARAIVRKPSLLLLDEPLSGLDANLRVRLLDTIRGVQRALGTTACYVTHDQEEALSLADRIAVLRDGKVLQAGTPEEIYRRPRTAFVAGFVGLSTLLPGRPDGAGAVETDLGRFPVEAAPAGDLLLAARPETVVIENGAEVRGKIERCRFLGDRWLLSVRVGAREVLSVSQVPRSPGEEVGIRIDPAPVPVEDDEETE